MIHHITFVVINNKLLSRGVLPHLPLTLICQKIKMSRDLDHAHLGTVCHHKTNTSRANQCTKFSHSRKI